MNVKKLRLTAVQKEVVARMLDGARIEYSEWANKGILVHQGINDTYDFKGRNGIYSKYPYRLRFPHTVIKGLIARGLIARGLVDELEGEIKHASIYVLKPSVIPYLTVDEVGKANGVVMGNSTVLYNVDRFPYTSPNGTTVERKFNEHIRSI